MNSLNYDKVIIGGGGTLLDGSEIVYAFVLQQRRIGLISAFSPENTDSLTNIQTDATESVIFAASLI